MVSVEVELFAGCATDEPPGGARAAEVTSAARSPCCTCCRKVCWSEAAPLLTTEMSNEYVCPTTAVSAVVPAVVPVPVDVSPDVEPLEVEPVAEAAPQGPISGG